MKPIYKSLCLLILLVISAGLSAQEKDGIQSMGSLEFSPEGVLFVGDSRQGAVYAFELNETPLEAPDKNLSVADLEGKIAALLGTDASEVLVHDMAVNPVSQNTFLSVSRGRAKWTSRWHLPNDLEDASILLKIDTAGNITEADLSQVKSSKAMIPNPVNADKEHRWKKGTKVRVDAITQIVYSEGKVYIAGLSNEEFSSAMWVTSYPFDKELTSSTLEIYHGAHGEYETHAPIRAFLPYDLNNKSHMLAAYLCTPLVTFETDQFEDKAHVKGRTVAEFGSGNYPLDMVLYQHKGEDLILMSNSQLPLLIFNPKDVEAYEGEIKEEVEGYIAGVKYTPRSGSGIQQLDDYNDKFILATQRLPSGQLALVSLPKDWLMQ